MLVKAIFKALQELDPDNRDTCSANSEAYPEKLSAIYAKYRATVDSATYKTVLVGDSFPFRYPADGNIRKTQIEILSGRCYRELSGGQQQRVLLDRVLCATQKMLLPDEPVSGLDPKVTAEMYTLIKKTQSGERHYRHHDSP